MMVMGAGSFVHTETSLQEIEQRLEDLERKHAPNASEPKRTMGVFPKP